jgi:hypothetical protein
MKRKGIPKSYHETDGCWNCLAIFIKYDYDESPSYYCMTDGTTRPLSGSVAQKESFFKKDVSDQAVTKKMRSWELWAGTHEVAGWGVCGEWRLKQ